MGLWNYDPENPNPPTLISYPEQFQGGEKLNLVCTQLDLSSYQQKKLVEKWCSILPELSGVKILWFRSRVNQALFEAACQMVNLEGLWIKWSGIETIGSITKLENLKFLDIGSSAQVESIEPFRKMKGLRVLGIENFKKIKKLDPIGELTQLEGLSVSGSVWTTQRVESLEPLSKLTNLRYLILINLRSEDNTLLPIAKISSLEHLQTSWWWKADEFRYLRDELPNLKSGNPLKEDRILKLAKK